MNLLFFLICGTSLICNGFCILYPIMQHERLFSAPYPASFLPLLFLLLSIACALLI